MGLLWHVGTEEWKLNIGLFNMSLVRTCASIAYGEATAQDHEEQDHG